jgi:RNA-splicing ligase RtcB
LSPIQVYEDKLKLKNKSEDEILIQQCEVVATMQNIYIYIYI